MSLSQKREFIVVCGVLAILTCLYFAKFIFFGAAFGNYDTLNAIFQRRFLAFRSGMAPLWNPYIQGGYPFFAQVYTGYLCPLNVFHFFFDYAIAQKISIVVSFLLGGAGLYAYARLLRVSIAGSFAGAITWMFSGYTLQFRELVGITLLPWVFFFLTKTLQCGSGSSFVLTVVSMAVILLGGNMQWVLYLGYALLLFALMRPYPGGRESLVVSLRGRVAVVLLVVVCVLLLTSIQFLSSYELTKLSIRSGGVDRAEFALRSMPPWYLLTMVIPTFFGSFLNPQTTWGGVNYGSYLYVGVLPLLMAFGAVAFRRDRIMSFFALLCIISLLVACAGYVGILPVLYRVPGFSMFRDHPRILWLFVFSCSVLAALGFDSVIAAYRRKDMRKTRWYLGFVAAMGALLIALPVSLRLFHSRLTAVALERLKTSYVGTSGHPFSYEYYVDKWSQVYSLLFASSFQAVVVYLVSAAALWRLMKKVSFSSRLAALVVMVINAFWFGSLMNVRSADASIFASRPLYIGALNEDPGIFRVLSTGAAVSPNVGMRFSVQETKGYEQLILERFYRYMCAAKTADGTHPGMAILGFDPADRLNSYNKKYLDMLNVKYVVSPGPVDVPGFALAGTFKEHDRRLLAGFDETPAGESLFDFSVRTSRPDILLFTDTLYLYRNPAVLPRAFTIDRYGIARSGDEALALISESSFDPSMYAVVEHDAPVAQESSATAGAMKPSQIVTYTADRIVVDCKVEGPCILVLSDVYYPGWRAYVDGRRVRVFPVNFLFRGVFIPAGGRHEVTFRFIPTYLSWGAGVSAAGVLLVWLSARFIARMRKT